MSKPDPQIQLQLAAIWPCMLAPLAEGRLCSKVLHLLLDLIQSSLKASAASRLNSEEADTAGVHDEGQSLQV